MQKYVSFCAMVLLFVAGCAALKSSPAQRRVVGNTFVSSSPILEIEVSRELQYEGDEASASYVEEREARMTYKVKKEVFLFRNDSGQVLVISFYILPYHAWGEPEWLPVSSHVQTVKNKLDSGKCNLGGREYHYFIIREGNYLQKVYLRNAQSHIRVIILYQERANPQALSIREELRIFNEHCEAAFTVK